MIAKAKWFNRRKYTGWGLTPKTRQGVLYIVLIAAALAVIQALPLPALYRMVLTGGWTLFILVDTLQVMAAIRLDEREQKIEAIAERNASWTMVAATLLTVFYVATLGKGLSGTELVPVLIFPIIAGVVVKGLSNYILDRREL